MAVTDRLLDLLSLTLSGQPYKSLGAPPSLSRTKDLGAIQVSRKNEMPAWLTCVSRLPLAKRIQS